MQAAHLSEAILPSLELIQNLKGTELIPNLKDTDAVHNAILVARHSVSAEEDCTSCDMDGT